MLFMTNNDIFIVEMCVRNTIKTVIFFVVILVFSGCGAMDAFMPSAGTYKVNARVNNLSLDDCSFIGINDKIQPVFESSIYDDPDVTGLMVFIKSTTGEILGGKVTYILEKAANIEPEENQQQLHMEDTDDKQDNLNENIQDEKDLSSDTTADNNDVNDLNDELRITNKSNNNDETIIRIKNLDNLPYYPLPKDLPGGNYTIVFQVLNEKVILHKTEKNFFYLADSKFSFKDIQLHLPGIVSGSQIIPKGTVVMLEAKLDFDSSFEPYITWYNGKKIISEGSYFEGAGNLLWKAPEQNGFLSLRAEVFPVKNRQGLAGFSQDVSLPVSTKTSNKRLLLNDNFDILHWYHFEGSLIDKKMPTAVERNLKSTDNRPPQWMPSNGTYGLLTGTGVAFSLPKVSLSAHGNKSGKILFRFLPVQQGEIFTVQFGPFFDALMNLSSDGENLVLTLSSSSIETISETFIIQKSDAFIAADIDFSILHDGLTVRFNIIDNLIKSGTALQPMSLAVPLDGELMITLGHQQKNTESLGQEAARTVDTYNTVQKLSFTAIWNEFAVLHRSAMETDEEKVKKEPEILSEAAGAGSSQI